MQRCFEKCWDFYKVGVFKKKLHLWGFLNFSRFFESRWSTLNSWTVNYITLEFALKLQILIYYNWNYRSSFNHADDYFKNVNYTVFWKAHVEALGKGLCVISALSKKYLLKLWELQIFKLFTLLTTMSILISFLLASFSVRNPNISNIIQLFYSVYRCKLQNWEFRSVLKRAEVTVKQHNHGLNQRFPEFPSSWSLCRYRANSKCKLQILELILKTKFKNLKFSDFGLTERVKL